MYFLVFSHYRYKRMKHDIYLINSDTKLKKYSTLVLLFFCYLGMGCRGNPISAVTAPVAVTPHFAAEATAVTTPVPVSLGDLYLIMSEEGVTTLVRYDLDSSQQSTLFTVPEEGWLATAVLNAAGDQFILAYAPPPDEQTVFGFTRLFLLPNASHAAPELLLEPESDQDIYFHPTWSPDGRFVYYAHTAFSKTTVDNVARYIYVTKLERLETATGAITTLAENATWPQLSPDGEKLVYVQAEADTLLDMLILADGNGRNPQTLIEPGRFEAIDAPVFSPDGAWIYFSAAEVEVETSFNWFGVQTARAHDVASNWYRLSLTTPQAQPERLTDLEDARNLYGRFSPHNPQMFAFTSDAGLYLMLADGSELEHRLTIPLLNALGWQ